MWLKKIIATVAAIAASGSVFAVDAGVTDTEIKLGASAVLSGPLGAQTAEYGVGSRLYFDAINQQGGIHGRKITYTTLDDKFDPKLAVENTRKLLDEEKVFLIYNNTGTGHTAAVLPLAVEAKTVVFSPVTGASLFREQFNRYLFHVRASYADEARHIHAQLSRMGIQRVALFYQDDAFGKTLQAEVQKAAAAHQMPLTAEVALDMKQPDFAAAAQALAQAKPQVVIMGTGGTTFTNLVKAMRATDVRPSFYGFSVAGVEVIKKELGAASRGVVLAQVFPSVSHVSLPVVSEYHRLLKAKDPEAKPSAAQLEGFVQAWVLVEGLKRTGRNLNTENFIQAMEKIGDLWMGKFLMRYTPQTHNGSGVAELAIIDHQGQLRH